MPKKIVKRQQDLISKEVNSYGWYKHFEKEDPDFMLIFLHKWYTGLVRYTSNIDSNNKTLWISYLRALEELEDKLPCIPKK